MAPAEALPLVRRVAAHAYQAGAKLVLPFLHDDEVVLSRFQFGSDVSFDAAPNWIHDGMAQALADGAARIRIDCDNPDLLKGQDPDKIGRANRAHSASMKPVSDVITQFRTNWSIIPYAGRDWSKAVFPDLHPRTAQARLFDAIFQATRVDGEDPVANWAAHNRTLATRRDLLTGKNFAALRFRGPGTDLTVGLADGHAWCGGAAQSQTGIICNANIPTEEVFTTPHCLRVDGYATSTKPLAYSGTLIDGIHVVFKEGRVVHATARTGESVLRQLIGTDEGASRLGEVALVPHSSPISKSGILFYETLFDENAAMHIAFGQSYRKPFRNWMSLSDGDFVQRGANQSKIHRDWMIGSNLVDVDGIHASGLIEPVMRAGEWV